jgi:mono/diheme cytochrome c family protein
MMMNRTAKLATLVMVLMLSSLAGFAQKDSSKDGWNLPANAKETKNTVQPAAESIAKGKKLYEASCQMCHGPKGAGDGQMASTLPVKVGNLADKSAMAKYSDGELFWMISKGKLPMPAFEKNISKDDRWNIVNYVRTFAK